MVAYQLGLLFEPHFDRPVWALASCVVACSCSLYSQSTSERARLLGAKCRVRTGHTELTMTNYLYGTRTRAPTEYRY